MAKKSTSKTNVFMSAKSDIIFKLLFGNELNKDLLINFLMAVLKLPLNEYSTIEISDPQAKRKYKGDKLAILDIKVKTKTGNLINIEIQIQVTPEMRERIVFYNAKMMTEQLDSGDEYDKIKKTISIVITGETFIRSHKKYHDRFILYSPETETEFTDIVEIHTLELPKLPVESDGTDLWDWLEFINADSEEELAVLAQKRPQMKSPVDKLLKLNQDSYARTLYEAREKQHRDNMSRERKARMEGIEEGIEKGRQEGMEKGRQEGMQDVARSLLKINLPIENIVATTGLTIEEIKKLQ